MFFKLSFLALFLPFVQSGDHSKPFQSQPNQGLQAEERLLRSRYEEWKLQLKYVTEIVKHVQNFVSDSKPKSLATNILLEIINSVDSTFPHSAINIEKEWACFDRKSRTLSPQEFKFAELESYDEAHALFDRAKDLTDTIEAKANYLLT